MSWLLTLVDQEQVVMSDQLQQNTWHEKNDNFNERKKNLYLKNDLRNALTTGSYYQVLLTLFCWLKAEQYHSCFTLCTEHAGCCSPPEPRVWASWPYAGMQNNDWLMHRLNENSLRFRCGFEHFQRVCCFADSSFDSTPFKYFNEIKIWHIKLVM